MKDLVVIIPIYKSTFQNFELLSLRQTFKLLSNYQIVFVGPESLNIDFLNSYDFISEYTYEQFSDSYFENIDGYNKLLLKSEFYKRFSDYKYMLICQMDVYVFRNDLKFWIDSGYDYVGAPWIASKQNTFNKLLLRINNYMRKLRNKKCKNTERIFKVGNGGFSLRKINRFITISENENLNINNFLKSKNINDYHIEDVFWSLYVPKIYKDFIIPDWKIALDFCIDRKPKLGIKFNNNNLPMACHGFNKKNVNQFWKKYIKAD